MLPLGNGGDETISTWGAGEKDGGGKDNWKEEREADLTELESGEGKKEREKKGKKGRRGGSSQRGRGESTSTTGRRKAGKKMYSLQEKEQGKKKEEGEKELRYHQ